MNERRQSDTTSHETNGSDRPLLVDTLRAEALFEAVPDAVIVYDLSDRCVLAWNPAAEQMFGYSREEALDLRIEDMLPEYMREGITRMLAEYLAGTSGAGVEYQGDTVELPALHKSGREMFVQFSSTPVGDPTWRHVMTIVRDLTERKQLEEERERLLADAREHAERVSELARLKDDFTAMVAHELVAPVASIRGLVDLLDQGGASAEQQRQMLGMIRSEAQMLQRLVNDVRDAATIERDDFAVQVHHVPVSRLISEASAATESRLAGHAFSVQPVPSVEVLADPERVGQILRNLLINAAKYTPEGTQVVLRAVREDGQVRFEVEDHGPGIDADDLDRIFVKFGRGRDADGQKVPGVGLGLYLSRRIALAHGGDLMVRSEPGKGSTFSFALKETRS